MVAEAETIVCCTAESRDRKTGEPRKDKGGGADGAGRISDLAARLDRFGTRNGLFAAEELAVPSDGAAWIRNVCGKVFAGRNAAFILDRHHALEYGAAAVRAPAPDKRKRKASMKWIKKMLNRGRVARVIACLKPHRERDDAVAACIDDFEASADRMRCDLYRKHGLPVGSGVAESACKQIVESCFKRAGRRWSKAGANALPAVKCCLENNRRADFLEWSAGRVAAAYP